MEASIFVFYPTLIHFILRHIFLISIEVSDQVIICKYVHVHRSNYTSKSKNDMLTHQKNNR